MVSNPMTEEAVRAVFLKNYSGKNLNETLRASSEEMALAILAAQAGAEATLPDIVNTIVKGRSRIDLFRGAFASGQTNLVVSMGYIFNLDHVRKALLDTIVYMRDNYETAQLWFRERFTKEDLKMMSADIAEAIEKPTGLPANVRSLSFVELQKEEEFFSMALIGIIGLERFLEYAQAYNRCAAVLRQCQAGCKVLGIQVAPKVS